MDEYSTPISQLKQEPPTGPNGGAPNNITDYSQILQNIQQNQQQQHQMQQPQQIPQQPQQIPQQIPQDFQYIPPPSMQSLKPQPVVHNPMGFDMPNPNFQKQSHQPNPSMENNKEVIFVIGLCLLLYSNQFQSFFSKIIPALYKDNSLSSVGNIIFPFIIGALFHLSKLYL